MSARDLEHLARVRDLDGRIAELEEERAALPEEYALEQRQYDDAVKRLKACEAELLAARRAAQSAEGEVKAREEQIKKIGLQQATAKTNKEYTVLLDQINAVKIELNRCEESGLVALESVEKLQAELGTVRTQVGEHEATLAVAKRRTTGRENEIAAALAELYAERAQAAAPIEGALMSIYDQVRKRRGVGLVKAIDGVCQGCFMKVTPQEWQLLMGREIIVRCRDCSRILMV